MIKVGSLLVDISANVANIKKDFNQIHREIKSFQHKSKRIFRAIGISFAGIFSVYSIYRWTKTTIQAIDTLEDLSAASGMTMKQFGALAYSAQFADISMEKLQVGTKTLAAYMLDAEMVGGSYRRYFDALGLTITDTNGKLRSTYDVLLDMADKFHNMADGAEKTAIATRLMGRSGAMLIPVLNEGREALEKYLKEFERFGAYVAPEVAAKVDLVKKNFLKMKSSIEGISFNVMGGLSDSLGMVTNGLLTLRKEGDKFILFGENLGFVLRWVAKSAIGLFAALELSTKAFITFSRLSYNPFWEWPEIFKEAKKQIDDTIVKYGNLIKAFDTPLDLKAQIKKTEGGGGLEDIKNRITEIAETYKDQFAKIQTELTDREYVRDLTKDELRFHKQTVTELEKKIGLYTKIINKADALGGMSKDEITTYYKTLEALTKTQQELLKHKEAIKDYTQVWGNVKDALKNYANEAANMGKQIEDLVTNALKGMEDALVEFVRTGKLQFKDMVNSILSDLARLAIRQYFTGPLAGMFGLSFHQGGIVGSGAGALRMIPAAAYSSAPRYHSGLRSNEIPAILERGEEVVPKEQAGKHLSINVPVTIAERNPLIASTLRESIENTVLDVIRRFS